MRKRGLRWTSLGDVGRKHAVLGFFTPGTMARTGQHNEDIRRNLPGIRLDEMAQLAKDAVIHAFKSLVRPRRQNHDEERQRV